MTLVDVLVVLSLVSVVLGVGTVAGGLLAILVLGTQASLVHAVATGVGVALVTAFFALFFTAKQLAASEPSKGEVTEE